MLKEKKNSMDAKYVIITPVRDEEAYLKFTIESMLAQTILPSEWVIVNDGSTDATGSIIEAYAHKFPWIHAVHRENRGFRKAGGGVVDAFNDGYRALHSSDWDFIVKFDGDLSFEPDYFRRCFDHFDREPRLGVGGGVICYVIDGAKQFEKDSRISRERGDKNLPKKLLGRNWWFLAGTGLGHYG